MPRFLMIAATATAVVLGAGFAPAPVSANESAAQERVTVSLSRSDARKVIMEYYERRGERVRIRRSWVSGGQFYAKVVNRFNDPVSTVAVDMDNGRLRFVNS